MSNTYDYLPDCFDHQLWLVLVDVMAAVFGYEEACVRDECRVARFSFAARRTDSNASDENPSASFGSSNGRAWARTASGIGPSGVVAAAWRITTLSLPYPIVSRSP
jgi:hypothetical protein